MSLKSKVNWSRSLGEISRTTWESVGSVCKDAAVFVDDGAGELLHWAGGIALLGGCVGVYDLHSELAPIAKDFIAAAPYCHVVIVVSTFLHGVVSKRIASLLSDLQPLECHIFCSQTERMHAQLIPMAEGEGLDYSLEGYSHFGEFQALMRKWINREAGVRVSVQHLPLFHAEVCHGLVTTPPYSTLFPLLPSDIVGIQSRLLSEGVTDYSLENLNQVNFDMLTRHFQTSIKGFASGLNGLLEEWDMVEEIFSLGPTSRFIANQLAGLSAAKVRRKTAAHHCSLLLVDRTLDLTGPALHHTDSLADRILTLLPRTSPCSNDVAVDMTALHSFQVGVAGSLVQSQLKAKQLLRTLITSKQKDSLMAVSRCLLDSLTQEGLSVKLSGKLGRPSATQLKTFIHQFKDRPQACVVQRGVLQLACAVVQAMEGDIDKSWDRLATVEKMLLLSQHDKDAPSIAVQLAEEARRQAVTNVATPLTLAELLGVGVALFSLVGVAKCIEFASEETELNEAFADLAVKWRSCDVAFLESLGIARSDSHAGVVSRFDSLFQILEGLGTAREQLTQFSQTFSPQDPSSLPYRPLLSQVIEAIFSSGRPELPDLYYHSQATVSNLIKSGFSLFVSSARPRPNQHPVLLLFVVGGVSCSEVRQIREAVTSCRTDVEVVIGTTRLTTPHHMTSQLLTR